LIHFDDSFNRFPANHFFVPPGPTGKLAEQKLDAFIQYLPDQRTLA